MKWFSNLKTMAKLMLAFCVLVAVTVGVGYLGVTRMSEINTMLITLYERDMLGLSEIKEANVNLMYIGRAWREALLTKDPEAVRALSQDVEKTMRQLDEHLANTEKTLIQAEAKAKLAEIKQQLPAYYPLVRQVISMAQAGRHDEALTSLAQLKTIAGQVTADLSAMARIKEQNGKQAYEDSDVVYEQSRTVMFTLIVLAAFLSMGVGYFIARLIARPLLGAVEVLQAVGAGDYTRHLDLDTKDEVGQMAAALNAAVNNVRTALEEVKTVADTVAAASQQLSSASQEIASGAQEQASSLEETAASLEEITSTVKQNADNAQQANQLANGSREVADKGGKVVGQAVEAMAEINQSSKKIADIITAIDEIAFQTNLLALNAAVEAARAGEQGRGFAVVAAEVRNLAQRSASAAKEIKGLIQDSVRKVEVGTELVNRSGETLQQILTSVKRVTDIVSEIAAASREQTTGIEQVNKAVTQMDQVTQANASQTEEMSSTAESLSGQAEQLQDLVARFKLGDEEGGGHGRTHAPARRAAAARPTVKQAGGGTSARRAALSRAAAKADDKRGAEPADEGAFVEF